MVIGLGKLKLFHVNDSKKPLGSRVDRHEHIGKGFVGLEAFRRLVNDARFDLTAEPAANKAADRAAIRQKALTGGYGLRLERVARIVAGKDGGDLPAALPAALKADLKTLRSDAKGSDARKEQAARIWSKALAGGYGSTVESLAKEAKARTDARCAAQTAKPGTGS